MNNLSRPPHVIFLNQMAGPLFRELAEDLSRVWAPSLLITGHPDTLKSARVPSMNIMPAPAYLPGSYVSRLLSWSRYFLCVLFRCWCLPRTAILFIASNPPFLALIGYLLWRLRRQRYVVLVYDIYPDVLVQFGPLKESGLLTRLWRKMNRLVWENAEIVFTIGDAMAANLEQRFDAGKTIAGKVLVVPIWANTDWIRPRAKEENEFAIKHGQLGKLTVMYSGNLGQTHDIETIIAAAKELREHEPIGFMIIGEGAKKRLVEQAKSHDQLDNLTLLPFQPEHLLPVSLPTAEIAVVTLDKGSEALSVPSKTCYYMAAGCALIGLCPETSQVAAVIQRHDCGLVVKPGDTKAMVSAIRELFNDRSKLDLYRSNSRTAAEKFYSRKNTSQYVKALSAFAPYNNGNKHA